MEALRQSFRELAVDRGRILLVTLGVVWGALSLSVVLAFGAGFERAMKRTTVAAGDDLIRFWNGATTKPWRGQTAGRPIRLTPEDATALLQALPDVQDVSVEYATFGDSIEFKGQRSNVRVHGVDPVYGDLRHLGVQPGGRFLNEIDSVERRRIVFLGNKVNERVFGNSDSIGKTVNIWGLPFTVVGVLRHQQAISNYEGMDEDKIFIPATTFYTLRGWRWVSYLVIRLRQPENDLRALSGIKRVLGRRHVFDPGDEMAVNYFNHVDLARRIDGIIGSTRTLLVVVVFFGLMISLVGVANVMYVMVEERRREIGIQMAIGARRFHVIKDRLIEGMVITIAGGLGGVVAGVVVIQCLNMLPMGPQTRDYLGYAELSIPTALGISMVLGIAGCFAGYWPARKAASLEPVKVLNEE